MTKPKIEIENAILECLQTGQDGLSISEIADKARVQRTTATKHLNRLRDTGRIREIPRTRMRLFKINEVVSA